MFLRILQEMESKLIELCTIKNIVHHVHSFIKIILQYTKIRQFFFSKKIRITETVLKDIEKHPKTIVHEEAFWKQHKSLG